MAVPKAEQWPSQEEFRRIIDEARVKDAAGWPVAQADEPEPERARKMLDEQQVLKVIGISRTTLWRWVTEGSFPKPVYPRPKSKLWFEDEVVAWQNALDEHGRLRRRRPASA
jgi:predicted DNA-binding transcriptional regulator AlpA